MRYIKEWLQVRFVGSYCSSGTRSAAVAAAPLCREYRESRDAPPGAMAGPELEQGPYTSNMANFTQHLVGKLNVVRVALPVVSG